MSNYEFTTEFNQAERALMAFAWRLTRDENDALDLFQETAYRAFKSRHSYIPNTNLLAWLTTIMRNTFINNYRKSRRRQVINDETGDLFYINSGSRKVANGGESRMMIEEITGIIEKLDDIIRVPFLMHLE
jgi:RNA polymerase sigma-70 factor (ECF subfamily)